MTVLFLAHGGFQGDRLLGDLQDLAHLIQGDFHLGSDLLRGRLPPDLLHQITGGANQLVDGLDHVDRDTDRARLVGNRPGNRLANPPRRICRELVTALVLELVHRLHETDVPFLNEIQKLQSPVGVFFGDADHQAEIGLDQLLFGEVGPGLSLNDGLHPTPELLRRYLQIPLVPFDFPPRASDLLRHSLNGLMAHAQRANSPLPMLFAAITARNNLQDCLERLAGALFKVHHLPVQDPHLVHCPLQAIDDCLGLPPIQRHGLEPAKDFLLLLEQRLLEKLPLPGGQVLPLQLPFDFHPLVVQSAQLAYLIQEPFFMHFLVFQVVQLVFSVLDDLTHANLMARKILSQLQDIAQCQGARKNLLNDPFFPLLDLLGDLHLALAAEERDGAHLPKVHPYGIACLAGDIPLHLHIGLLLLLFLLRELFGLATQSHSLVGIDHLDIHFAKDRHDIIYLVRRYDIRRQHVIDLIVGQVALLLAEVDELLDLFDVFLLGYLAGDPGFFLSPYRISVLDVNLWRSSCRYLRTTSCHSSILSFLVISSLFSSATRIAWRRSFSKPLRYLRLRCERQSSTILSDSSSGMFSPSSIRAAI